MSIRTAEEILKGGNLPAARDALQAAIREDPSNAQYRIFLFQLLCVSGDWKRALTQLNVAAELDPTALLMAQAYRELISCELYREGVFGGSHLPLIFGEPMPWMAPLVKALSSAAEGKVAASKALVEEAFELADTRRGHLDGQAFEWIADADMRLGPVLEAMIDGKYYWIPMDAVQSLSLSAPEDLRDLVWAPVEFTWTNQGKSVGFVPARYPGIGPDALPAHAMARQTDWVDLGDGYYVGHGQRMFSSDSADFSILQVKEMSFSC